MPKVSAAHRESRRDQITAAALTCFAQKGFQRTSMADIIAASGLSAGAIYLHFESKQQIALAVGRQVLSRRLGDLDDLSGGPLPDPVSMLRIILARMVDDMVDSRLLMQLWGEATSDPEMGALVGEIFGTLKIGFTRYLTAWATQKRAVDPERWATRALPAVLALAQGFMVQRALVPGFDAETYFDGIRLVTDQASKPRVRDETGGGCWRSDSQPRTVGSVGPASAVGGTSPLSTSSGFGSVVRNLKNTIAATVAAPPPTMNGIVRSIRPRSPPITAPSGIDPQRIVRQLPCTRPSSLPGMMLCRSDITSTFQTNTPTLVTK